MSMYKLFKDQFTQGVIKIDEALFIPLDKGNIDYHQYLAWLADGNEPLPADEVK